MVLDRKFSKTAREFLAVAVRSRTRSVTKVSVAIAAALALAGLALALSFNAKAAPVPTSSPLWGTLDTQTGTAATEDHAGVTLAMFEFNWASFEPSKGVFSASLPAPMRSQLAAYQAARTARHPGPGHTERA